jgi:CDP-diglyceride synthetase
MKNFRSLSKYKPLISLNLLYFVQINVGCISFRGGAGIVLLWSLTSFMADTGALVIGSRFGKTLMAPKLSPKKTWEGTKAIIKFYID